MTQPPQMSRPGQATPPHKPLPTYYDDDAERHRYVNQLFDRTAKHYNTIEALFLNGGLLYRRLSLKFAGLSPGMKVLDVAIGTGAVSRGAVKLVGPSGRVFGVDPSRGMMNQARKHFRGPLTQGVAERLPFADEAFDFVTMGIALRHVADLKTAFSEYCRVLKPGGNLWILESHVPKSGLGHRLTKLVWAKLIPGLTYVSTGSRDAKLLMDFYWDTVEQCVPPPAIVAAMKDGGFAEARYKVVVPGAFCEYIAKKAG